MTAPHAQRATVWHTIPAGTPADRCNGPNCQQKIWWVRSEVTGRMVPIETTVEGGRVPSDTNDPAQLDILSGAAAVFDGRGVSHQLSCIDRERFNRGPV